jgi:radical SAM/Cys-rich protein
MDKASINGIIRILQDTSIRTLDITGGTPELNTNFRYLVAEARELGCHVIVRSNLTIFFEEGMGDLPEFYRDHEVEIIASLPYYMEENVDRVRGAGTFQKSIRALQRLNSLGFGIESTGLKLNLVYNPQGAFLPPSQSSLEEEYKRELKNRFNVSFNCLYTFANIPIGHFKNFLIRTNNLDKYMDKLMNSFNPETLEGIMCRHLISVDWDGRLFDCDFNQILGLSVSEKYPQEIGDFDYSLLSAREIAVGDHCYGCTAGQGST